MGKRYYCDYCDRSFADSPLNRKKHVNGVQHLRSKKLHYDSFKDPAQILAEEAQKIPCKRFFQTGTCDFGVNCRYSHTNPQMLIQAQATSSSHSNSSSRMAEPKIEVWLARWEKKRKSKQTKDNSKVRNTSEEDNENTDTLTLPPNLPPLAQLPPSLLPPPPGGHPKIPKLEWV